MAAATSEMDFDQRREELIKRQFEPALARLGLSVEEIEKQTLDELHQSLEKVNEAIEHPESFGTLRIRMTAKIGLSIVSSDQESHMEIGILPLLLERKSLILRRIKALGGS